MAKDVFGINHEFSWDQMYGGFLPRDANPFRKAQSGPPTSNVSSVADSPTPSKSVPATGSGTASTASCNDVVAIGRGQPRKRH